MFNYDWSFFWMLNCFFLKKKPKSIKLSCYNSKIVFLMTIYSIHV